MIAIARRALGRGADKRDVVDLAALLADLDMNTLCRGVDVPTRAGRLRTRVRGHGGLDFDGAAEVSLSMREAWIWLRGPVLVVEPRAADSILTCLHELGHVVCDPVVLDAACTDVTAHMDMVMQDRADRFAIDVVVGRGWELPVPLRLHTRRWKRFAEGLGATVEVM